MSYSTDINESVAVWAFFNPLRSSGQVNISPIAMNWQKQLIKFKKIIFTNSRRVGQVRSVNLVCASETANFELEFDSSSFLWKLKKVMPKEA